MKTPWIHIICLILACLILSCQNTSNHITQEKKSSPLEKEIAQNNTTSTLPFEGNLKYEASDKKLPKIDSIMYFPLNSDFDFNFKNHSLLKTIELYNNKLPEVHGYQVYYSEIDCTKTQHSICKGFVNLTCGFLILYDKTSRIARILNVENSFFIDSGVDMTFRIEENYKIHLKETGMTDSDVGPDEPMVTEHYGKSNHVVEIDPISGFLIEIVKL